MRTLVFLILSLFYLLSTCAAADITIKKVMANGKTAYMLEAGAFPHENNALQFKFKLSSLFKLPISIEHITERSLYVVKIGPVDNIKEAQSIQQQINASNNLDKLPAKTPLTNNINTNSNTSANTNFNTNSNLSTNDPSTGSNNKLNTDNTIPDNAIPDNAIPDSAIPDTEKKLWNLRNADIRAVIGEISRVTGKNFLIDPRVQGKISIVSSTPMSDKELYQVFLSMLQVSGYAAVPSGDIIKVIPNIDAKTVSTDFASELRNPPIGDDMMVEVVPVHYVPAEQLVPILRPLMPQWSSVSAYGPSNMLILSGRANNIKRLAIIIKQVDSSTVNGIDIVPLRHALAMDVANTLKDLVKAQPGGGGHSQTMLAADDRSNAILLSGNRTERIRLRLLIEKLDRQSPDGSNSNTQVVYLNYLRAEDLVPILAGIAQANFSGNVGTTIGTITRPALDSTNPAANLTNSSSSSGSATSNPAPVTPAPNPAATPGTTGATTQNEGSTKPTVQIIAEPNTNSIIINAPPSLIRILKSVISQLDIRPAQLLIEALVAEVNATDVNNLGIEWGSNRQTGEPSGFRPGFAIINGKTNINDFQAQIYALAREHKANILSTPSVVVLDNRQAKILVGKQVSVASTSYPNNGVGTTTASPFTTFDRVNVALHLYVRPQITRGDGIQMQIDQGNDTLEPVDTTGTSNPIFNISSIVTSIHVESGDIVVLGGLTQDSLGNDDNKLPILGDIPGLGRLFQRDVRTREKRVLMVFIRPVILKNQRDSLQITGGKYDDTRKFQLDILHDQKQYHDDNEDTVLPPLQTATLPRPFSNTPPPPSIKKVIIQ